jgi:hypothetical protein
MVDVEDQKDSEARLDNAGLSWSGMRLSATIQVVWDAK